MKSEESQQDRPIILDIVEGREGISRFGEHWDDLFARATGATPFLSRIWASTFVEAGRIRGTPLFILAWSGTGTTNTKEHVWQPGLKLVGLFALAIRKCLNIKIAEPIGTGQGSYLGILLDPDYPQAVRYMAEAIRAKCIASLISIEDLWTADIATNTFFTQLAREHFLVRRVFRNPCPYIRLDCSYEQYMQNTKSAKTRQTLRRKERQLYRQHAVNIEQYKGGEVTSTALDRIAAIQEQSWMKRRGAAVLGRSFYQKLLLAMSQAGFGRLWLMTIDGADAAFVFALVAHRRLYYVWTAFKLEYCSSLSIGQFLTKWTIRDACRDNILSYDFEHGEAEYKRFWSTDDFSVYRAVAGQGFGGRLFAIFYFGLWKLARIQCLHSFYRRIRRMLKSL